MITKGTEGLHIKEAKNIDVIVLNKKAFDKKSW